MRTLYTTAGVPFRRVWPSAQATLREWLSGYKDDHFAPGCGGNLSHRKANAYRQRRGLPPIPVADGPGSELKAALVAQGVHPGSITALAQRMNNMGHAECAKRPEWIHRWLAHKAGTQRKWPECLPAEECCRVADRAIETARGKAVRRAEKTAS